jgi:phospholipid-binding lipoprotein MlaA
MYRYLYYIVLFLLVPALVGASESGSNVDVAIPDLLADSQQGDFYGPDLLLDDPFIMEPVELMGDPIFEDDFRLNDPGLCIKDPLEPMNRLFFEFNDKLYFWVLKPTKNAYSAVLPTDIRQTVGNFFANLAAPISFVNNILQGEMEDAGVVLARFLLNSTLGVAGLGDPAFRDFDLEPRDADFGETLGKWGVGEGVYLVWPGLGPSNVRDTVGFFGDVYLHPALYLREDLWQDLLYLTVEYVNILSVSPEVYDELKRISLDPYVASRQAFFEYRRAMINDRQTTR